MRDLVTLRWFRSQPQRLRMVVRAVFETRDHLERSRAALSAQIDSLRVMQHGETALLRETLSAEIDSLRVAQHGEVDSLHGQVESLRVMQHGETALLRETLSAEIDSLRVAQHDEVGFLRESLQSISDREPWLRERLGELRSNEAYLTPFTNPEPLVSVIIATFDNYELLGVRAIPSVLAQTYQTFEIVVVGDAAPDQAQAVVESFGDARLRYSNLTYRGPYPSDPVARWHVAGVPPYNEALRLARGQWIAPLDDDDAFRPEHLERLLQEAQRNRLECAYGRLLQRRPDGGSEVLGRFPPEPGHFGLQMGIYHAGLAEIFAPELSDALFDIPADWAVGRRMLRAGVRMGMVDEITVDYYPSQVWSPRDESLSPARPEWEYVAEGWDLSRHDDQLCSRGWDVDDVALAYVAHWPDFAAAISAPRPLGVAHELTPGGEMTNTSVVAHNTAMTLAYVVARTSRHRDTLSVLDWGGGIGHQHAIVETTLPEIQCDWHIRELPAVCREGRKTSPTVTFHDNDECLERGYDLVLASGSFQYSEDWRRHLHQLAGATLDRLLITRLPLVDSYPSFVVIQRAQAYGYATEYIGWVFNRSELLEEATAAGLELEREFFLQDPMPIARAPEPPTHGAFLFTTRSGARRID